MGKRYDFFIEQQIKNVLTLSDDIENLQDIQKKNDGIIQYYNEKSIYNQITHSFKDVGPFIALLASFGIFISVAFLGLINSLPIVLIICISSILGGLAPCIIEKIKSQRDYKLVQKNMSDGIKKMSLKELKELVKELEKENKEINEKITEKTEKKNTILYTLNLMDNYLSIKKSLSKSMISILEEEEIPDFVDAIENKWESFKEKNVSPVDVIYSNPIVESVKVKKFGSR